MNIGDIAHTPGVLTLLERHLPAAEVRLWPSSVGDGVASMLRRRFPKLVIVDGKDDLRTAFRECDFLLHGSGPSVVGARDVARWRAETGKPFGVYGVTLAAVDDMLLSLLEQASFVFCRDSVSLELLRQRAAAWTARPDRTLDFAPDGAFAVDLRDDAKATAFLMEHGLTPGQFFCCIPRLRFTPYWRIRGRAMSPADQEKHAVNEAKKEQDHAPLRAAIERLVREAGTKVLICPEDQSQMAVGKEMLFDPLPNDVKRSVVWRDRYWLTDEALSVYVRAAGLFGNEMHSPIMCVGNGVPAIVCRWAEQTSKGFMWRDIGLGDWLFDADRPEDRARLPATVLSLANAMEQSKAKVAAAQALVRQRQQATMAVLARHLTSSGLTV